MDFVNIFSIYGISYFSKLCVLNKSEWVSFFAIPRTLTLDILVGWGPMTLESFLQFITLLVHILWSVLADQFQIYLSTFFKKKIIIDVPKCLPKSTLSSLFF